MVLVLVHLPCTTQPSGPVQLKCGARLPACPPRLGAHRHAVHNGSVRMTSTSSKRKTHPLVHVQQGLVPHVERTHELQGWDLEREVEGCDDGDRAEWEPVAGAGLPRVVPGMENPRAS